MFFHMHRAVFSLAVRQYVTLTKPDETTQDHIAMATLKNRWISHGDAPTMDLWGLLAGFPRFLVDLRQGKLDYPVWVAFHYGEHALPHWLLGQTKTVARLGSSRPG